jgi:ABC-type transport system substrate-binding protein
MKSIASDMRSVLPGLWRVVLWRCCAWVAVAICGGTPAASAAPPAPASASTSASTSAPTSAPAPAEKVLHLFLTSAEGTFDPAVASDLASLSINENLFDPLLRYDYLARPVRLTGNTSGLPQISSDGLTYTFELRPGIRFIPDPAFKDGMRELVAQDYVYSIKRLYDPALKSPWLFMFEGKLAGDEALRADGKFDIDTDIAGLQAISRYQLRLRLNAPEPNLLYYLATGATAALAREVVTAFGPQTGNHPVGTGPFRVGQWQRSHHIQLLANPAYHLRLGQSAGSKRRSDSSRERSDARSDEGRDDGRNHVARALAGQRLPRVDKIEVAIVEEAQARVLGFLKGEFDYLEQLPPQLSHLVMDGEQLKPALRHLQLHRFVPLQTYYMWMNLDDAVLGGYTPDKIALRRAISMSYNRREDMQVMEHGLSVPAQSPLPPDIIGYNPRYRSAQEYNPQLANRLLDHYGYLRAADGWRSRPGGQALTLSMHSVASGEGHLRDEVWRKSLTTIGLRVVFVSDKKSEIIKASRLGKVQMFETNWLADFPDGESFLQLLYGPNKGRANYARFDLPAYNLRYEQARKLPAGEKRQKLYDEMSQLIDGYAPWVLRIHPVSLDLVQPWVKNHVRHPVELTTWRYLDVAGRR